MARRRTWGGKPPPAAPPPPLEDTCFICYEPTTCRNRLMRPCPCSLRAHHVCLARWITASDAGWSHAECPACKWRYSTRPTGPFNLRAVVPGMMLVLVYVVYYGALVVNLWGLAQHRATVSKAMATKCNCDLQMSRVVYDRTRVCVVVIFTLIIISLVRIAWLGRDFVDDEVQPRDTLLIVGAAFVAFGEVVALEYVSTCQMEWAWYASGIAPFIGVHIATHLFVNGPEHRYAVVPWS